MHPELLLSRILVSLAVLLVLCAVDGLGAEPRSLAERLGHKASERLLIINGDDAGMCHAANLATIESLEKGLISIRTWARCSSTRTS